MKWIIVAYQGARWYGYAGFNTDEDGVKFMTTWGLEHQAHRFTELHSARCHLSLFEANFNQDKEAHELVTCHVVAEEKS